MAKSSIELMRLITKEYIKEDGEHASHITVGCVYKVTRTMKILGRGMPALNYKLGDTLDEEEVETLRRAALVRVTIT